MKFNYIADLNPIQLKIVTTVTGPIIVIAGAGSGKTRILTYRIAHLMNQGIDPLHILALTFTNKSAREMKQRIAHLTGNINIQNLCIGTFHSVFARILHTEIYRLGYPSDYTIYDQKDAEHVIKKIIEELHLEKCFSKPKTVLSRISRLKNNLITVQNYFDNFTRHSQNANRIGYIYQAYIDRCFKYGAMDFDDILLRTNELFTRFPEVLSKYQEQFKYILVDEYQDTNYSQYLIIRALASRYKNLFVVGDDAQSIYAFRGANIKNIQNFQLDYPYAKIFRLEQNYRSTVHIVQAANNVIACNKEQMSKKNWTNNEKGEKIKFYGALSDKEEGDFVANTLFEIKLQYKLQNKDFAILYRTNAQSRALEESLNKKKIPYKIYGGISFYQRKEIKDLLAYLRILVNPNDEEALLRIINYPPRGIGPSTINKLLVTAKNHGKTLYEVLNNISFYAKEMCIHKRITAKLKEFFVIIKHCSIKLAEGAYATAKEVVKTSDFLSDLCKDNPTEGLSRYENVQEFINSIQASVSERLGYGDNSLSVFLKNIALASDIEKTDDDRVSLMTVHLSKGLEFTIIFIVGMEENLFPSMLSVKNSANLEEERRLFYVALTRAKKQVILSYATTRHRWGGFPSRFIEEIGQERLTRYVHRKN
ncbi:ATP-dependent helicase [Candidatus Walczuchella monophlebidarum]|uniref:DNA 3'-5' helicase n=1 Tax=Candidatus Walczuchella monophlebidarum TaxID=1415657 RepID=A0A068DQC0_9FLAO|nr:UvrD-helicase domain-containing protein [Candidatus Walczuchella monophlebidarum]AID37427.1 PcrA-like UvrD/Rep family ATP-dependent DNA helicase [Candidatus Walczuchella monophlebidarum]